MSNFGGSGYSSSGSSSGSSSSGGAGWGGVAAAGVGMLAGIGQAQRQYHRQKKLNVQQYGHQRMLNQQGHDLQFDMWNKTNYKAQMEHMKAAGLNPALMYGSAGAPGTTGSQGGGSAQGGQAGTETAMDMSNIMLGKQLEEADSRIGLNKDLGYKAVEEGKAVGGYKKEESGQKVLESKENIKNLKVARDEMNSRIVLNAADGDLKRSGIVLNEAQGRQIDAMIRKLNVDVKMQKTILELDYGDDVGRNWMAEAKKVFGGEFDTSTYVGAAATIAGIAILRNPAVITNLMKSATKVKGFNRAKSGLNKVYEGAVKWFKSKFK